MTTFSRPPAYAVGMDIVYADELFFRNGAVDYLLLLAAARLRGLAPRRGRTAAAAAMGGVYAVLAALPPLRALAGAPCAAAASLALALVAYGPGPGFWRSWGCFLCLAAALGGAVLALGRLGPPGRATLPALGLGYAALRLLFRGRLTAGPELRAVELTLGDRTLRLEALVDTGNRLYDPLTGRAVLVADPAALAGLFLPPLPSSLPEDPAARFRLLSEHPALRHRLRLVGFSSLGTDRGLLVCFRPDRVRAGGEELRHLVAFSPTSMADREYNAIL